MEYQSMSREEMAREMGRMPVSLIDTAIGDVEAGQVVRFVDEKMTPAQSNSLSNLYVLQWRWGLHEDALTDWQTIVIVRYSTLDIPRLQSGKCR